ncbi:MAG: hypothetical protein M3R10_06880 [Verrucomicrobiota bacterium]|nr:hypothetical protein [Verrucomicrobiota bacterium]
MKERPFALSEPARLTLGRLLTTQLYEVPAHSPSRRATLVNLIQALRTE